jgi:nicotinamide mononucleotide transporter
MSALNWLFEAQLTIGTQHILWREIIGNLFGLASAVLGMRRVVWAWPVGVVGNALLLTVFLGVAFTTPQGTTLYGQAGRQVFFILTSAYGWWRWQQTRRTGGDGAPAVQPRWATGRERILLVVVAVVGVAVLTPVFRRLGSYDPVWADAWIFVGSMLATYAMARGWVEFWLCWIAVDLVGVPVLLQAHFYPSALLYGVYGGFVIWGFVVWLRLARTAPPTGVDDPATQVLA